MNRLASAALAGIFFAATGGVALAANDNDAAGAPAPVANLGSSAPSGYARNTAAGDRMTHALNLLEAKGYGGFRDFTPDGKNFAATVDENGQHVTVIVDPDSDQVTRQG